MRSCRHKSEMVGQRREGASETSIRLSLRFHQEYVTPIHAYVCSLLENLLSTWVLSRAKSVFLLRFSEAVSTRLKPRTSHSSTTLGARHSTLSPYKQPRLPNPNNLPPHAVPSLANPCGVTIPHHERPYLRRVPRSLRLSGWL